ncbi:hypothetical protein [Actinoplanes sp. NPDC051859]|uniref:hypothetical protein n=1 Tax=Actinoplanes sp. NPDC051859 TaxID=3363909 RepID=UPI00379B3FF9
MSLTGVSLLVVVGLTAFASAAATIHLWSVGGRWRVLIRTVGILFTQIATVLCIGLAVNRSELFYPSWAALAGDTGTQSTTAPTRTGELDSALAGRTTLPWQPSDLPGWRLSGPPTVTVPPEYHTAGAGEYPVLVVLGAPSKAPAPVPGAVTVALTPTKDTTAEALRTLIADLRKDLRVTERGWALVAGAPDAALAGKLATAHPDQFRAFALAHETAPSGTPAGIAVAVVRPPGKTHNPPAGVTVLHSAPATATRTAIDWATSRLSAPLAPPLQLPTGKEE